MLKTLNVLKTKSVSLFLFYVNLEKKRPGRWLFCFSLAAIFCMLTKKTLYIRHGNILKLRKGVTKVSLVGCIERYFLHVSKTPVLFAMVDLLTTTSSLLKLRLSISRSIYFTYTKLNNFATRFTMLPKYKTIKMNHSFLNRSLAV